MNVPVLVVVNIICWVSNDGLLKLFVTSKKWGHSFFATLEARPFFYLRVSSFMAMFFFGDQSKPI